jgi:hypothetical protein
MADLFSVTAPLTIRFRDGTRQIMIERMPYRDGLLYLPPFWEEGGIANTLRFVAGPVRGEGPWKVGDAVVTVLGCHGTDPALAGEFAAWQDYVQRLNTGYPAQEEIGRRMHEHAAHAMQAGSGA